MILRLKGSKTSGWHSPPKGTHSGEKHRQVGSGKSIVDKSHTIDGVQLVDNADDLSKSSRGTSAYLLLPSGDLLDVRDTQERYSAWQRNVNDHEAFMLGMDDPSELGLDPAIVNEYKLVAKKSYDMAEANIPWDDDEWDRLNEQSPILELALLNHMADVGVLKVRSSGRDVAVYGPKPTRRSIGRMQDLVLQGKIPEATREYGWAWGFGRGVGTVFTFDDLMRAKNIRDFTLKDGDIVVTKKRPKLKLVSKKDR